MSDQTLENAALAATYRTHRLPAWAERHLFAWLGHRRHCDEHHAVLQDILRALEYDPDLLEDHSWTEIEALGRRMRA